MIPSGSPSTSLRPVGTPLSRREVLGLLATVGALAPSCAASLGVLADDPEVAREAVFLSAVTRGDETRVVQLLDEDARLARTTDASGRSAFVLAHLHGQPRIAALLAERGLELDVVEAVLAADWERVEALATANPQVMNAAHPIGGNPLYASGLVGGREQYRLRSLGCDSNGRPAGGSGFTPARGAMDCRDPVGAWMAATDLLSNGGDVNAGQARGDSILHAAVRRRDARLVELALRKHADTAARDQEGRTPLELARALGWDEGQGLLGDPRAVALDHRASRFAFNASREPFALLALDDVPQETQSRITGISHFNPKGVKEMLAADPRLIHAISTDAELAIEACGHTGQREVIRIHLDHGAPLSLPTALSLGDLAHARWLLENDPLLIHERGPHDFPILWYPAIGGGSLEAAELLLDAGAPIEQESGGETALHWAAMRGHPELIRYLVERGADLEAVGYRTDRAGLTPYQLAVVSERDEAAAVLRELRAEG